MNRGFVMTFEKLYLIIRERLKTLPKGSYVASLYRKGEDAILQKIGEETTEVIIAAKGKSRRRIIEEIADLYFMTIVLITKKKISLKNILEELERRRK